jgi:hypothetical protein
MSLESVPAYSGFRGGPLGRAYNEAAFRHFLAIERRRAVRSRRPLLLVLVSVRRRLGASPKLTGTVAAALFSGLGACIREVDFVGWYREGRVAAAVLTQGAMVSGQLKDRVAERMVPALRKRLAAEQSRNLRVRVIRLGGSVRTDSR